MIIDDLITNRTQEDASYAAELAAKGQDMTTEEWAAYLAGLRGAYNYTDLNRVTEAMEYINDRLSGYGYETGYQDVKILHDESLDPYRWYETDKPKEEQMDQYLSNVKAIRRTLELPSNTPNVPEDMEALTYEEANDIEQILVIVEEIMNRVISGFRRSGQFAFWSGTLGLPCADSDFGRTWEELDKMEREWNDLESV
jgi:hypothetical protein